MKPINFTAKLFICLSPLTQVSEVNKSDLVAAASHIVWQPTPVIFNSLVDFKSPVSHNYYQVKSHLILRLNDTGRVKLEVAFLVVLKVTDIFVSREEGMSAPWSENTCAGGQRAQSPVNPHPELS